MEVADVMLEFMSCLQQYICSSDGYESLAEVRMLQKRNHHVSRGPGRQLAGSCTPGNHAGVALAGACPAALAPPAMPAALAGACPATLGRSACCWPSFAVSLLLFLFSLFLFLFLPGRPLQVSLFLADTNLRSDSLSVSLIDRVDEVAQVGPRHVRHGPGRSANEGLVTEGAPAAEHGDAPAASTESLSWPTAQHFRGEWGLSTSGGSGGSALPGGVGGAAHMHPPPHRTACRSVQATTT